jgi:hypothetical protein
MGPIRQTAFVVDDIEQSALDWAETYGAGPFFLFDVELLDTTYRGSPSVIRSRMALGQLGDQQIELIQPTDDARSVYREFIDSGRSGVHHVCFWHDVDEANALLTARGYEVVHEGRTAGGDRFSYVSGPLGPPYIEIVQPTGGSGSMATFFSAVAAAADGWDGTEPLRGR